MVLARRLLLPAFLRPLDLFEYLIVAARLFTGGGIVLKSCA